ncbi:3'-5' exonuclease [Variovorax paradoxus]|uniref:3'-5' exonuclease n=1 Tax=Variovorax paradoxus TaxID=34073 RepID=UPI003ECE6ABD
MVNPHWSQCHFVVLDVEGNGGSPQELVEIAVIHILDGKIETLRDWTVRPAVPVTPHATRVHGITNVDLVNQPPFADIASDLKNELGSAVVVGHHVGVDLTLMKRQLINWHPGTCIDTLRLSRHVFPSAPSYALGELCSYVFGESSMARHRAKEDANMTARLFLHLMSKLDRVRSMDLLTLARLGASADDPALQAQQGDLF